MDQELGLDLIPIHNWYRVPPDKIYLSDMTNNTIQVMEEKYRRREETIESLVRAEYEHELHICYLKRISRNYYELCRELERWVSMDGLPEDTRAALEEEMAMAEATHRKVQAEIEEEHKYKELMKSLKDKLKAL